jgi:hypothetical protein
VVPGLHKPARQTCFCCPVTQKTKPNDYHHFTIKKLEHKARTQQQDKMGSQASKVNSKASPTMIAHNGKPYSPTEEKSQARADAASTAALLSRLHLSQSTVDRRQLKNIEPSSHEGHPPSSEISLDSFARWQNAFERNDKAHFASTVLSKQNLNTALLSRQALAADKQVFSHTLSVQPFVSFLLFLSITSVEKLILFFFFLAFVHLEPRSLIKNPQADAGCLRPVTSSE